MYKVAIDNLTALISRYIQAQALTCVEEQEDGSLYVQNDNWRIDVKLIAAAIAKELFSVPTHAESYSVEREDQDDGSIHYLIFDSRPATYRYLCSINDDGGGNPHALCDAKAIVYGLNLLAQHDLN